MSTRQALFGLAAVLWVGACDRGTPVEQPLLDGHHEPEVLTEAARLEWPPSQSPNRFVRGWASWKREGGDALVPDVGESVLELVNLKRRKRGLTVRFAVFEPAPGRSIRVCIDGEDLGSVPLTNPLEIQLPAELPLGRLAVTLNCGGNPEPPTMSGASLAVESAVALPVLAAGEVRFEPGGIVQAPWSSVDLPRLVGAPTTLAGSFNPPVEGASGLRFTISIEWADGGGEILWEWPGGAEHFELELPRRTGLVRVRLSAEGTGAPGRWENLRLLTRESSPRSTEAPAPPKLVVLYILDALRADALGHLGGAPSDVSPTIDRLAAEGVTFTNHFSVAPNTMPSTKALFTGRAFRTRGGWKLPADAGPTLAERWLAAGYRTGAFSANAFVSHAFGLERGFEHSPRGVGEVDKRSGNVANAERVHRFGLRWLDRLEPEDKAFLYLHTVHPHNPYAPPEPFRSRFTAGTDSEIDGSTQTLRDVQHQRIEADDEDRARLKGLYRGGLAYNDAELAKLLEILEARYDAGEMLFVITADHGEELFDHGGVLHGYTLYDEQLHIPLIFWWPGVIAPARLDIATDQLDLHATLRALVDRESDGYGDGDGDGNGEGQSLWGALGGEASSGWAKPVRFAAASSLRGGIFMARSDDSKFIWAPRIGIGWGMGEGVGRTRDAEYFFDLRADPGEHENLAGGPTLEAAWLRSQMRAWIEREKLLDLEGASPDDIDDETRKRLRALGYLD